MSHPTGSLQPGTLLGIAALLLLWWYAPLLPSKLEAPGKLVGGIGLGLSVTWSVVAWRRRSVAGMYQRPATEALSARTPPTESEEVSQDGRAEEQSDDPQLMCPACFYSDTMNKLAGYTSEEDPGTMILLCPKCQHTFEHDLHTESS